MKDNKSICSNCDKKTNDDINTKWDLNADPYCYKCFLYLNKKDEIILYYQTNKKSH